MQNGKFGVDALARQAVRFLHLCFEGDHPRVRGQTVSEVSNKIGQFCIQCIHCIHCIQCIHCIHCTCTSQVAHQAGACPSFCSMK